MTIEELQQQLLDLQDKMKVLEEDKKAKETKLSETEKALEETKAFNQKLYLRITEQVKTEDIKEPEKEPTDLNKLGETLADKF